uniref:Protein PHLOEM PROTEIN 2-LIKE A1 n=1 Tax=Anthurium amnicola TaxID=1678845 RepID=A0A1D1YYU8_9ARAE
MGNNCPSSLKHQPPTTEGAPKHPERPEGSDKFPISLPHRYEVIVAEADDIPAGNLEDHIYSGIFLNHKRKKFWVDEKSGCNCFTLFARELSITWGNDKRYWEWYSWQEARFATVEVARLLKVVWLEIDGKFDISYLTPGATYQLSFLVLMIDDPSNGWDVPVNLSLTVPTGNKQTCQVEMKDKPKEQWLELVVGEFKTTTSSKGDIEFSLYQNQDWKSGLIVKGVSFRPKK